MLSARRLWLIAFLMLMPFVVTSVANDEELAVGKVREGVLSPGKAQPYVVMLMLGILCRLKDPRGKELVVRSYDPSGSRFRGDDSGA